MLEHHFWENFRKWVPHPEVDEVYDVEEIGFEEDGFVVLLRPDHFEKEKRSNLALRLVWDKIVSYPEYTIMTLEHAKWVEWTGENDKEEKGDFP